jgi:hypothetical protein
MNAYRYFFWGFLFIFDFRFNGLDILPDFVGYWLFLAGLKQVAEQSSHFLQAKTYVWPLLFISILDLYQIQGNAGFEPVSVLSMLIGLVLLVLDLLVVYHMCQGIIERSKAFGDQGLEYTAEKRWKYYLVLKGAFFIMFPLIFLLGEAALIFFIPYIIISIVVIILMMGLMKQAEASLLEELS